MTGMMVHYEKPRVQFVKNNVSLADCAAILRLYCNGASPGHLAKLYGISGVRVRQIVAIEKGARR